MSKRHIDRGIVLGVLLAVSGVILGLVLEGGSIRQIIQPTAALIVLGGSLGAVLIQFPTSTVSEAARALREVLLERSPLCEESIDQLLDFCVQARRKGVLSLDPHLEQIDDAFLRKGLTLAVDGVPAQEIRNTLEIDLDLTEQHEEGLAMVLEAAGGFAPTMGIIGAVLGLIQVMQRMDNIGEIGKGIAVAFVSTLYGIGLANLCLLPLAGKLRIRMRQRQLIRQMTLEAILLIVEGASARSLRQKLESFLSGQRPQLKPAFEPEMAIR